MLFPSNYFSRFKVSFKTLYICYHCHLILHAAITFHYFFYYLGDFINFSFLTFNVGDLLNILRPENDGTVFINYCMI